MLIRSRTLTGLLFITLAGTSAAGAAPLASSTHQTEQDKARQEALAPQQQDFQSSQQRVAPQGIPFPEETHCKLINRVDIDSDNQALTRKLLAKTARQAQGRCLGSEGIRLLAYTLQNELIAQGYITSLIDVPSQSLEHGILRFTLHYGKVGAIDYADGSDTTRLWNSLPTSSGTILRLSDLEQGMANLQRLPGATAHMKLLPGQHEGESDIQIARSLAKKWQLGAWLDDAGSKASGRYQAGGALYLYDLTTLNDILYLSGGGDIEFNQHNDGNHNGSLYYSIPFGYWTLSAYGAYSQYRQQFNGNWSTMDYKSKNRYYSATLSRLLSHTRQQKTTADLRIAKSSSHYYFGGSELLVMRKQNPSWEFTVKTAHAPATTNIEFIIGSEFVRAELGAEAGSPGKFVAGGVKFHHCLQITMHNPRQRAIQPGLLFRRCCRAEPRQAALDADAGINNLFVKVVLVVEGEFP